MKTLMRFSLMAFLLFGCVVASAQEPHVPEILRDGGQVESAAPPADMASATEPAKTASPLVPRQPTAQNNSTEKANQESPVISQFQARPALPVAPTPERTASAVPANQTSTAGQFGRVLSEDHIQNALPIISTDVIAPSHVNVGAPANIRIVLSNYGQEAVRNLNLGVFLSEHLTVTETRPAATRSSDGRLAFAVGSIEPDGKTTIFVTVVSKEKKPFVVDTELLISSRNRVEVTVNRAELEIEAKPVAQAVLGKAFIHQLTVRNAGDGGAENVQVNLNLPQDLQLAKSQKNVIELGFLDAGESRDLTIATRPVTPGSFDYSYEVVGDSIEPKSIQRSTTVSRPELFVEAQGPKVNIVNRPGTYSIRISNPSDVTIRGTKIVVALPRGMTITTISRAGDINNVSQTATWAIDHILPGQSEDIKFRAVSTAPGPQTCDITVRSNETEPNQIELSSTVFATADLAVNIANQTGGVRVGDTATFEVQMRNNGSQVAEGVQMAIELPEGLTASPSADYDYDASSGQITFKQSELPAGEIAKMSVNVECSRSGNFVIRTTLSHQDYPRPLISEASLFVLESQQQKVGRAISPQEFEAEPIQR